MVLYCVIGFIAICFVGCVLHFVYDGLRHNQSLSLLVAVNESTWEHLKLAVFPMYLWLFIGCHLGINNLACGALVAILTVMTVIPLIFYTYRAFTKRSILIVDITSFFVAVGLAMFFAYLVFTLPTCYLAWKIICIIFIIIIALCFLIFTYFPPHIFLFKDPISQKYGVQGHYDDERYGNNFSLKDKTQK